MVSVVTSDAHWRSCRDAYRPLLMREGFVFREQKRFAFEIPLTSFVSLSPSLLLSSVLDEEEEEEGEPFEFDDYAPEAERPPSFPPAPGCDSSRCSGSENVEADLPPPPPQTCPAAPHGDFPPPPEAAQIRDAVDKELPPPPEGADTQGRISGSATATGSRVGTVHDASVFLTQREPRVSTQSQPVLSHRHFTREPAPIVFPSQWE